MADRSALTAPSERGCGFLCRLKAGSSTATSLMENLGEEKDFFPLSRTA